MSYYWSYERRDKFAHYVRTQSRDVPVLAVSVKDFRMWVRDRDLLEIFTFAGAWSQKLRRLYYYMNAFSVRKVNLRAGMTVIEYLDVPCATAPEFFAGLYTFGAMMVLPPDVLPMKTRGMIPELKRRRTK